MKIVIIGSGNVGVVLDATNSRLAVQQGYGRNIGFKFLKR